MKRNIVAIICLLCLPALLGAAQALAVGYNSTYKRTAVNNQSSAMRMQATTRTPAVGFQSTSSMPVVTTVGMSNTLNADGTVNGSAYGIGLKPGLKRDPSVTPPPNPGDPDEEEDDGNTPIGDAVWPLMLLACAYLIVRAARRKRIDRILK